MDLTGTDVTEGLLMTPDVPGRAGSTDVGGQRGPGPAALYEGAMV